MAAIRVLLCGVTGLTPRVAVQGRVKAGNPADYVSNTCALRPQAVSLTYADLTIDDVFTNPDQQGTYAWNGVFRITR